MKTNLKKQILYPIIIGLINLLAVSASWAVPGNLTFQGRLVNSGVAVESNPVVITLTVTSIGATECTLYEETHTLNMINSDGVFSVKLGSGTRTSNDEGLTIAQVFSNKPTAFTGLSCSAGGSSYTPVSTDSRNVYVTFNDNGTNVAFASPFVVQSVPYALEAQTLAGKSTTDFVQVTTATTQTKINDLMASATYSTLFDIINGTSNLYAKPGSASFSANVDLNNNRIVDLAAPSAATDATNKQYVDGYVGGKAVNTTALSGLVSGDSGKVLSWTGSQWTAAAPADSTKLPLSGGTMTGSINMGGNLISNLGYMTQDNGKYFQIGSFDNTTEAALASALLASHKGATWYNTTLGELRYWNGTQVKSLNSATADSANTVSTIVARDSSGDFAARNITVDKVTTDSAVFTDSGTDTVTIQAPSNVTSSYTLKWPAATVAGDAGKVLSVDASGNLNWIASSSGSVTSVGVSAPLTSTGGTTPTLSIAKADASTNGYLAASDFTAFSNKQTNTLASGNIWVGNGSSAATAVTVSGDASLSNSGSLTVTGLRGKTVSATAPTTAGQLLRYDGTSTWVPGFISLADVRSTVTPGNTIFPATSCTTNQTMTWSSLTDTMTCSSIAIDDSQITYASQSAKKFLASPNGASGAPTFRSIASSDLPTSGTGSVILSGGNNFGASAFIGNADNYGFGFMTNNATRMTILANGNVGIGVTNPSQQLELSGSALFNTSVGVGATPVYKVDIATSGSARSLNVVNATASGTAYGVYVNKTGAATTGVGLYASASGSTNNYAAIFDQGRVGVGTTTPIAPFHATGASGTDDFIGLFTQNGVTAESSAIVPYSGKMVSVQGNGAAYFMGRDVTNDIEYVMGTSTAGAVFVGSMTYHDLLLRTENSTKMVVKQTTGNVGIANLSPITQLGVSGQVMLGSAPTTLTTVSGAHTNAVTTINVVSTTGYPQTGVLLITDNSTFSEAVSYTGTTATSFTGVTRGYFGSTATAIPSGSTVDVMTLGVMGRSTSVAPLLFVTSANGIGTGRIPTYYNGNGGIISSGQITAGTLVASNTISYGSSSVQMIGTANSSATDNWRLRVNSSERLRVDNNGVGIWAPAPRGVFEIGTAIPASLSAGINASTTTIPVFANTLPASGTLIIDSEQMTYTGGGTTSLTVVRGANGTTAASHSYQAAVGYYSTPAFIVTSAGNVGIGVTSPSTALEVNGNVKATAFLYTSDKRLKENFRSIESPLDKILKLNGVEFDWKNSKQHDIGFIAQDVEKVLPDLVKTDSNSNLKSVQYGNIVAVVVEAVKELFAKTEKNQNEIYGEIATIKKENEELRSLLIKQQKQIDQLMRSSSTQNRQPSSAR